MRQIQTSPEDEELYQELCAVLLKYEKRGTAPLTLLAIVSQVSGKLIACLDPFKVSVEQAMNTVAANLESGNHRMQAELLKGRKN